MEDVFNPSTPIYLQLAERINRRILRGELCPGDKLPSVRDLAIQSGVNPNTVQRTYRELEIMSIVETKRGQGTFVTEKEEILQTMRQRLKTEEISHFVSRMQEMGYSKKEMMTGLEDYLTIQRRKNQHD